MKLLLAFFFIMNHMAGAYEYSLSDTYNPNDYTVNLFPVLTAEDVLATEGTHKVYYQNWLIQTTNVESKNAIRNDYLLTLSPYNGFFRYIINVYFNKQIIATAYLLAPTVKPAWQSVLIMADGFDPANQRTFYHIARNSNYNGLLSTKDIQYNDNTIVQTPLSAGFAICFVDFACGAEDIRFNAKILLKVIETVCAQSQSKVIVGGFSMGGVIARLALLYAEKQNLTCADKVYKFISVDSPQNGATIPLEFQNAMDFFVNHPNDVTDRAVGDQMREPFENAIKSPAAIQMLYKHVLYPNSVEHDKFYSFLNDLGGYPKKPKKYAIANSDWKHPYPNIGESIGLLGSSDPYLAATINNYNIHMAPDEIIPGSYTEVFNFQQGTGGGLIGDVLDWTNGMNLTHAGAVVYAPTGTRTVSLRDGSLTIQRVIYDVRFKPTFIPVTSVFGLSSNTPVSLMNGNSLQNLCASGYTSFNKLYLQTHRDEHITFDPEFVSLIMNAVLDYGDAAPVYSSDNFITPLTLTVQGITTLAGEHRIYNARDAITVSSLTVSPSSFVSLTASNSITFSPGFSASPGSNLNATVSTVDAYAGKRYVDPPEMQSEQTGEFQLLQNSPNPFNPETTVRYSLPVRERYASYDVSINIFDLSGRQIRRLASQKQCAGDYSLVWDGKDNSGRLLPSGTYLCRLTAGKYSEVIKMSMVK